MSDYRRAVQPGGTFFLTLVTHHRRHLFVDDATRAMLRRAVAQTRHDRPFDLIASVLLPDHIHLILALPPGDADFSTRIAAIKARFTRAYLAAGGVETAQSPSRTERDYRGVWQMRFWEHLVRDEDDLIGCVEYIHYNPVKHGLATCPHAWPWSSFKQFADRGDYPSNWCCSCTDNPTLKPPRDIAGAEMD